MYQNFKHKVNPKYLKDGDLSFHVGAAKVAGNLLRCATRAPYGTPWFVLVHPSAWQIEHGAVGGWSYSDMLTDHPVYSEGWEYLGDGTRITKFYLVSEELPDETGQGG